MFNDYRIVLHKQGFRMTPQRIAIMQALETSRRHMTPLEIFESVNRSIPGISEPTVYRALSFLSDQGLLLAAHIGNGQLVYEAANHNHHHLICRKCGQTREIDHHVLEPLYDRLYADTGYRIDGMHVTFFGLCPDCERQTTELPGR